VSRELAGRVAYIKTSLIDFPGRLACVLFLPGCNFRCPYCHNAALVQDAGAGGLATLAEFFEFLDRRRSHISGVVLSGGEPLLGEEVPRIARAVRARGLALKLDTNGSLPARIADTGADYVALDFKTAPSAYGRVAPSLQGAGEAVLESLARLRFSGSPFEVRVTCAPGIVGRAEIEEMSLALESGDEVVLQDFRPGGCLDPAFDAVAPYPREEMEGLLSILRARSPRARIRGSG
jgi:pyruvate formate lyase activating enzyme